MKIGVVSDTSVKTIAEWLNDNISPGYAFVPSGTDAKLAGLQYRAFDEKWAVEHYVDYRDKLFQYVDVKGLQPEEESMLCLVFR